VIAAPWLRYRNQHGDADFCLTQSIKRLTKVAATQEATMTKTYSSKSNALRAFKSQYPAIAADYDSNSDIAELYLDRTDAGWTISEDAVAEYLYQQERELEDEDEEPTDEQIDEALRDQGDVVSDEDMEAEYDNDSEVPVQPLRPIKGTGAYKDVPLRRRTTDGGAVNWAWWVFTNLPAGTSRKHAIAEAVRVGIAFYTARTQYQKWTHRNDPKPEAK
jgi:hypothetical protein